MSLAEKAATAYVNEVVVRLNDPLHPPLELDLRRMLRSLRDHQRTARPEELGVLFGAIGSIHYRLRDFAACTDAYRNAARYEPNNPTFHVNLSASLIELDLLPEARAAIEGAKAIPNRPAGVEVCIFGNTAEIEHRLGNVRAARDALELAMRHIDPAVPIHALIVADMAATLGYDDDAVELLARSIAGGAQLDLGDHSAIEFLLSHREIWELAENKNALHAAFERVAARNTAREPPEHQISASIDLTQEGFARFMNLLDSPGAPT